MEETRERPVIVGTKLVSSHALSLPSPHRAGTDNTQTHSACAVTATASVAVCVQLHSTGFRYTTNTKVKKVKSKRNLNDGVPYDDTATRPSSTAASATATTATAAPPAVAVSPARESRGVSTPSQSQSPGIHRGSIVPMAAINSTDLLMADDVQAKSNRRKLKRTASERKRALKGKGRTGKEEKETEWIYEERELKIAICCVIV